MIPSSTTTVPAGPAPNTTPTTTGAPTTAVGSGAAVATAEGVTLSVLSSPRQGLIGQTAITARATLTGAVPAGTLHFTVGLGPLDRGQPATDQSVAVSGPGTYSMPEAYCPIMGGAWAVGVSYDHPGSTGTVVSVSGEAASLGARVASPQLVTTVAPDTRRTPADLYTVMAGSYDGGTGRDPQHLVVRPDGSVVFTDRDLTACPTCTTASAPTATVDIVLDDLSATSTPGGYRAGGYLTAESDPADAIALGFGRVSFIANVELTVAADGLRINLLPSTDVFGPVVPGG